MANTSSHFTHDVRLFVVSVELLIPFSVEVLLSA